MANGYSIAIHGGAGTILREQMTPELNQEFRQTLEHSVRVGHQILQKGGSAIDAVVAAVAVMEDSPLFNAGRGSVLTHNETVEMDASIMSGADLDAGAVAGISHIKNPIKLARDIMLESEHVMLIGKGAESFAFQMQHEYTEQDYFFTDRRYEQLQSMKEKGLFALSESTYPDDRKHGTVGAVALDSQGHLAAATSTGGVTNKKFSRVGDTAVIGAGTYARDGNVAVSSTGMGEYFLRCCVASDVAARMRYLGESVAQASETIIQGELKAMGGEGGLIAMDAQGTTYFAMNSSGMYRAKIDIDGSLSVAIFADEE
ncbi:isoaspartyl peptidase/L-asparaginase family protein [Aliivibrio kagoshimensis]|uniref:isoaspartyl peptidase/L-asparaginase family protein n=1 Tax=Aliivibrio kagoshimensis TaxID=2910230 RepID=UPI003D09EC36